MDLLTPILVIGALTAVVLWAAVSRHVWKVQRQRVFSLDRPVMPVDTVSFRLKPTGFFDRNPTLDVPPT